MILFSYWLHYSDVNMSAMTFTNGNSTVVMCPTKQTNKNSKTNQTNKQNEKQKQKPNESQYDDLHSTTNHVNGDNNGMRLLRVFHCQRNVKRTLNKIRFCACYKRGIHHKPSCKIMSLLKRFFAGFCEKMMRLSRCNKKNNNGISCAALASIILALIVVL